MKVPKDWRRRSVKFNNERESVPLNVLADGALKIPTVAGGKLIPLIILDVSDRPDINEYVRVHQEYGAGDVSTSWGATASRIRRSTIVLRIEAKRPIEINIIVEFNVYRHTELVSAILNASAVYIQPGEPGDKLSQNLDKPKILIEVRDTGFRDHWFRIRKKIMVKRFRRKGYSRRDAETAATEFIRDMGMFVGF